MQTILILGDQLNRQSGALKTAEPESCRMLFVTSRAQLAGKRWHRQRLHLILAGMAKLARSLRDEGFHVDEREAETLSSGIAEHRAEFAPSEIVAMSPTSWRAVGLLETAGVRLVPNDQFLCDAPTFAGWASTRKSRLRMEDFYRWQRERLDVLLEPDGQPKDGRAWPEPELFPLDDIDLAVSARIDNLAPQAFGAPWRGLWPTTTGEALIRLDRVIREVLPHFGPHEDAMLHNEWHLAHTLLSSSMNTGLLHPSTVIERAQEAYRTGAIPLASAEGFIRQIIGWREYVWGLYWLWMPEYGSLNELNAQAPVPPAFLGAPTKMRCVSRSIADMYERSYAHHIQRLMVMGNLALLADINPQAMTQWMWAGFIDAAEWVMVPNVVGMSLHGDGGKMATKPYAAGGAYISKMSDYCKGCSYDPKKRTGDTACPFTTLYWDFLARHEPRFKTNHRMAQPVAGMRRLSDLPEVRKRAEIVLGMLQAGTL
jgi:deoxyribodipyrimidine photolyase-related protein